jgi:hypothetical protein
LFFQEAHRDDTTHEVVVDHDREDRDVEAAHVPFSDRVTILGEAQIVDRLRHHLGEIVESRVFREISRNARIREMHLRAIEALEMTALVREDDVDVPPSAQDVLQLLDDVYMLELIPINHLRSPSKHPLRPEAVSKPL